MLAPPAPRNPVDAARWEHTRQRRRILTAQHETDVRDHMVAMLGRVRAAGMPPIDLSSNALRAIVRQLGVRYMYQPRVTHPSGEVADLLGATPKPGETVDAGILAKSGLWSILARNEQWTLALNEMFVQPMWSERWGLQYRLVPPDLVTAEAPPEAPSRPHLLRVLEQRHVPGKGDLWCWEEYDLRNPEAPAFRIISTNEGRDHEDVTADAIGTTGWLPQWRDADGAPRMPWGCYHKNWASQLFDPYEARELVDATLTLCVGWMFFWHVFQDASWPQRGISGGRIEGGQVEGAPGYERHVAVADPTAILRLIPDQQGSTPTTFQWSNSADPQKMAESLCAVEERVATVMGVEASNLSRTSGDPRSGYALAVTNEGKKEARRIFGPQFTMADQELVALTAIVLNRSTGSSYPEDGYRVEAVDTLDTSADEAAVSGALLDAIQGVTIAAAKKEMPPDTAQAILEVSLKMPADEAKRIIDPIRTWQAPAPKPSPFGSPFPPKATTEDEAPAGDDSDDEAATTTA